MQFKHIITLLLKFVSNHEVQVRSPVPRYLYRRYTKNMLNRYRYRYKSIARYVSPILSHDTYRTILAQMRKCIWQHLLGEKCEQITYVLSIVQFNVYRNRIFRCSIIHV